MKRTYKRKERRSALEQVVSEGIIGSSYMIDGLDMMYDEGKLSRTVWLDIREKVEELQDRFFRADDLLGSV